MPGFFAALNDDEAQVISVWKEQVDALRNAGVAELRRDLSFSLCLETLLGLARAYEGVDDKAAIFLQLSVPCSPGFFDPADTAEFCSAALELERKITGISGAKRVGRERSWGIQKSPEGHKRDPCPENFALPDDRGSFGPCHYRVGPVPARPLICFLRYADLSGTGRRLLAASTSRT